MNNLRRIDLNLLVTLDALLEEQNVTRTAERLHFSQPSISVHLGKLREIFDDPLLLPGPRGMQPTVRAAALRGPLRQALAALELAVVPQPDFNPQQDAHTWRVAASDYSESAILMPLMAALRRLAPATRMAVVEHTPHRLMQQTGQEGIELVFHTSDEGVQGLRRQVLFTERYVLAGRAGHPQLHQPLTPEQFCDLEQIIVSPNGGGFEGITDEILAARGLSRKVVLSVPHFLFMKAVLESSDLVAMLPARLARANPLLTLLPPPVDLPEFEMYMFWPERVHRDPAHRWLRAFIKERVSGFA
ncbi:LysR substrate-binding domain-containing protein [Cedecea sp.]|jgi:DNA-binding transcriptional LysR family regulator|uniref:LysR substrate-binding domain-containing protein n=1 Tax=Cedecea sp. TaxID=1970739 RepID=UPI0012ADE06B|nr:LysR family transcriptional regulator [Enterobacteriaceae bacterium RIT693]